MPFEHDDVRRLIEIAEKEGWDEIRVETDDITFIWSTSPDTSVEPPLPREATAEVARGEASADARNSDPSQHTVDEAASSRTSMELAKEGLIEVKAPSLGMFWRSPKPGAPPFVEVGDHVEPNDTLCIIEVMKLMNQLKAEVSGEIVAIHVSNGEMIEYGQHIMSIVTEVSE